MRDIILLTLLAFFLWVWAYPREARHWYEDVIYD